MVSLCVQSMLLDFHMFYSLSVYGNHLTINWTKPLGWKGYMEHPPGAPFSPCPCDITSNFCDPSCCCDEVSYANSIFVVFYILMETVKSMRYASKKVKRKNLFSLAMISKQFNLFS